MNITSNDNKLNLPSSINDDHCTVNNRENINAHDKLNNKNNFIVVNRKSYEQKNNHQSPIEKQYLRSCEVFISILITIFLLISVALIIYQILKHFIP